MDIGRMYVDPDYNIPRVDFPDYTDPRHVIGLFLEGDVAIDPDYCETLIDDTEAVKSGRRPPEPPSSGNAHELSIKADQVRIYNFCMDPALGFPVVVTLKPDDFIEILRRWKSFIELNWPSASSQRPDSEAGHGNADTDRHKD